MTGRRWDGRALAPLLVAIGVAAVALPAWLVTHAHVHLPPQVARLHRHVVPAAELPPVEPTSYVDLSPEDARAYNATVPFVGGAIPAARRFRFAGPADDLARAQDCLAAAAVYEAGDDAAGERGVAQVVLNRLRHPAFPKTVCGVVFQGSERTTGCQFTFTCDGALTRWHPSDAAWLRAREVAAAALAGSVDKPIGLATHYHADYVVPYWQASLDKIAAIGPHLFYRWAGWWGTPPAFGRSAEPGEPIEPDLADLSDAHRSEAPIEEAALMASDAVALALPVAAATPQTSTTDPDSFSLALPAHVAANDLPALAARTCGDRPHCIVMGWADPTKVATTRPLTLDQIAAMSFSYLRDRGAGLERTLWNCDAFARPDPHQCMKRQPIARLTPSSAATRPAAGPSPAAAGPTPLDGVRRQPAPKPAATPPGTSRPATP